MAAGLMLLGVTGARSAGRSGKCRLRVDGSKGSGRGLGMQFEITVDCTPQAQAQGAKPFPTDVDVIVGLTVYASRGVKNVAT
jgi:hypothetical protein